MRGLPRYIETIPKQGFRFVAPVERISALPPGATAVLPIRAILPPRSRDPPGVFLRLKGMFPPGGLYWRWHVCFLSFGLAAAHLPGRTLLACASAHIQRSLTTAPRRLSSVLTAAGSISEAGGRIPSVKLPSSWRSGSQPFRFPSRPSSLFRKTSPRGWVQFPDRHR